MKKFIAYLLALAMVLSLVPVGVAAQAATAPRDGFTLEPTVFGATGVDISSTFVLSIPAGTAGTPAISIDGQPPPYIARGAGNTFVVTPAAALRHNTLYIFRLARDAMPDITWAFQTTVRFQVASSFPGNQAVNVPVSTGIEITFSSEGHSDIYDYFSVYPDVSGRFIYHGATAVFMPFEPLARGQLYTVTLRAGVKLPGTNEVITEAHVFSFETEPEPVPPERQPVPWPESVRFSVIYAEYPSFEPARVNFRLSYNSREVARPVINFGVYRLDDSELAVRSVYEFMNAPRWSRFAWQKIMLDTAALPQVFSFEVTERHGPQWGAEILELPGELPTGFYLIEAVTENSRDQMLLQVTDLAVQIVAAVNQTLVWVNDMVTGRPADATVRDTTHGSAYQTDSSGIAVIDRPLEQRRGHTLEISASGATQSHVFFASNWWAPAPSNEDYWTLLQLDRTLFQRSDTLYFWGFVQCRDEIEEISYLTVVLTRGSGWGWGGHHRGRDRLHQQVVAVYNGVYSDSVQLPHLDPGSYNLTILHGDLTLSSMFFSVQDFVKPPYQLFARADRRAAFIGEEVTFTANAEFFEGTPVSELAVSYSFSAGALQSIPRGEGHTDIDGVFEASTGVLIPRTGTAQGQTTVSFHTSATLPEIGRVSRSASVRVFINDISMRARASRTEENATLTVNINNITLERLNDGTARHGGDFLCEPSAGHTVSVEIDRIYWVRERDGEFYCFINRRVIPRYRYIRREETIDRFTVVTGADGEAVREFLVPNSERESYRAVLTTTDGNDRVITATHFIGRDFTGFHQTANQNRLFLYGARPWQEGYDIGDEVELTVRLGTKPVTRGNFLFIVANRGILHFHSGSNPFSFTFEEKHMPGATVQAIYFNGHTYHSGWGMSQHLRFNSASRELNLEITPCRAVYRPGDMSTITIRATDNDGNPKSANVNISIVDEALFALRNYTVNTLTSLYRQVSTGIRFSLATHCGFDSDGIEDLYFNGDAEDADRGVDAEPQAIAPGAEAAEPGGADDTHIREIFEDTAIFYSVWTDANGMARFSFRLPDNITSWRLTASGVTNDFYAGNDVQNIIVTNPMFLHYSLNSIFVVGDRPSVGVNVYGTSLGGGEAVSFEVWDENNPALRRTASGTSFARVNIPLWDLEEGEHAIIIRAVSESGYSDAVRHPFRVIRTHHMVDYAVFYDVTADTVFAAGSPGLTNITITGRSRSLFLRELLHMRNMFSSRLEIQVMRRESNRLIETYFPDIQLFHGGRQSFNPRDYQQRDGGLSMLPHAESDLAITVRLMPFLLEDINVNALTNYLYGIFDGDSADNKMRALYGLAILREPVLLYLQQYAMLENLPVRDVAYIALGFAAIGETGTATAMYNERIAPHIQRVAPYYRVNAGTRADTLDATAVAALLAAQLGMPQREGLHEYTRRNHTWDFLVNITRLSFIAHEIYYVPYVPASIAYTLFGQGHTRDLSWWRSYTLRIPTQNLHEFELTEVTGDVGAVSIHRVPLDEVSTVENNIGITRRFYRGGETDSRESSAVFGQHDLVRVELTIDFSAINSQGSFLIKDFLPAGLVPVANSARFNSTVSRRDGWGWRRFATEGQTVMFFHYNANFSGVFTYTYYARVISPGEFTAEAPLVQNLNAREYISTGAGDVIRINE